MVYRFLFFLIIMLSLRSTLAEDVSFKMGPGIVNGSPTGSVKIFSVRNEDHLFYAIHRAFEGGLWVDNISDNRKSAAFLKYSLGVKPGAEKGVYAKAFLGIAGISHRDSQLGGNFQFSEDIGLGIRDKTSFVELGYTHFSSAGIYKPNKGRDFLSFSVGLRF